MAIDTFNKYMVGARPGGSVIIFNAPTCRQAITAEDALVLAAWLVTLADPTGEKFAVVLEAVQNT